MQRLQVKLPKAIGLDDSNAHPSRTPRVVNNGGRIGNSTAQVKQNFRKQFDLPAAKLTREDIENLGRLITDGLPIKPKAFDFSLSDGDATYRAYSLDELFSQSLPPSIDNLSFSVHGWSDDNKIDRGVTISLHRVFAHYQIHALDEVWYKGKMQQITIKGAVVEFNQSDAIPSRRRARYP